MKVRCWGARGSIAVSGPEYNRYGGDTPCLEVRSADGHVLVVDAGTGIRRLGNLLVREGITRLTMLFTHSHWDHIVGFPFFKPLYDPLAHILLGGCPAFQGEMTKVLGMAMRGPLFPLSFDQIPARVEPFSWCDDEYWVAGFALRALRFRTQTWARGTGLRKREKALFFLRIMSWGTTTMAGAPLRTMWTFAGARIY